MPRRAALAAALLALTTGGLAGCGFTPLYGTQGMAANLSAIDAQILVGETPKGEACEKPRAGAAQAQASDSRTAYLLREQLNDALARDAARPAAYRLETYVCEDRTPRGLGPTNVASRYELSLKVSYVLNEIIGGRELTRGRQTILVSYPAVTPPYAGVVAQQDSQQRAAAEAARRIRLELAEYFIKTKT
jgi:LPS-assembly lipoprotein